MNESEVAAGLAATPQYQYAQLVGKQLFVAGQVPHDAQGVLVGPEDPHSQAAQCLRNLNTVMSAHGFRHADIRRLIIYVVGEQANLAGAWSAVQKHFNNVVPPATLLGVARLGYVNQLVEVDATVLKS